jgi:hypothetical protein
VFACFDNNEKNFLCSKDSSLCVSDKTDAQQLLISEENMLLNLDNGHYFEWGVREVASSAVLLKKHIET